MSHKCGSCGCGSNDCGSSDLSEAQIEEMIAEKENHSRKYNVEYRISLEEMGCQVEELIDRVKAYTGIVDEVELTEEELIISYDDRLVTPAEISDLVQ
ncbi:hypothetical protein [Halanaerobium congolense]|jgi:hypothetical protein|uniref:Uncharacterized protein n=1 Tax=Halanaerobium congolense TaxID=54121 RepID=A0A1G6R432_9FIRM|nr:hypothetical protein [Halanaerobium congolense]PXV64015.1 hypothetical protein C8C78_12015 [Halanaerobium congolense]SDC99271.1 hypothetical protein SAMN04488597_12127 [Halanaerobium congolense]SDH85368.1 hypothetical protein SAMN04515651_13612 [Halanaerobium congolense]SHM87036.1 hypothetical protein SAMN04515650_11112 [Halanaerobium congolense]